MEKKKKYRDSKGFLWDDEAVYHRYVAAGKKKRIF